MGLNYRFKCRATYFFWALILLIFSIFFSCSNNNIGSSGDCISCPYSEQPDSAILTINVTINSENPFVPLIIYNEKYNPNLSGKFIKDTARSGSYSIKVPVNHFYSAKAEYKSGDKIIYAIDGSIFDAQQISGCDNPCWQVVGNNLNLKLKF